MIFDQLTGESGLTKCTRTDANEKDQNQDNRNKMKGKKQNESDNELANKEQDVAAMHVRAC